MWYRALIETRSICREGKAQLGVASACGRRASWDHRKKKSRAWSFCQIHKIALTFQFFSITTYAVYYSRKDQNAPDVHARQVHTACKDQHESLLVLIESNFVIDLVSPCISLFWSPSWTRISIAVMHSSLAWLKKGAKCMTYKRKQPIGVVFVMFCVYARVTAILHIADVYCRNETSSQTFKRFGWPYQTHSSDDMRQKDAAGFVLA